MQRSLGGQVHSPMIHQNNGIDSRRAVKWLTALCVALAAIATPATAQTSKAHAAIEAALEKFSETSQCPGASIGYVLGDGTAGSTSIGFAFTESHTPMQPEHRMMAGSTGKTFFAALALQLVAKAIVMPN